MIQLKINNVPVSVKEGTTILEAARSIGIKIPTLCHMKNLSEIGACRVCVVEVKGMRTLVASCEYPVSEGMEVFTNTAQVMDARKTTLELILSDHRKDCLSCERNTNCELQRLSYKYGCEPKRFEGAMSEHLTDTSTPYLIRDNSKCILCRRCIAVCQKQQGVGVIGANERGFATHIAAPFDMKLSNTPCIGCGQCINVCPTGALKEKDEIVRVQEALADAKKYVVVGTAPAVRAAIGEAFGLPEGTNCEGRMITGLRYLGFRQVFDVNCSADFTIWEEANELLQRMQNGGQLPMFTSCCPGWVRYVEHNFPEIRDHLSSCKSPQQMFGALVKSVFAQRMGIDPKDLFVVAAMPCTGKKGEKLRTFTNGLPDVDAVLTTRELAHLMQENGILLADVPEGKADSPFGEYTGAGIIFGASGGVMEAALRTAVQVLQPNQANNPLEFEEVRGMEGVKAATYEVGGKTLRIAVVNGLKNAKEICEQVKNGTSEYDFVEVMTCPGGCVMGGGQPIKATFVKHKDRVARARAGVLYKTDKQMAERCSLENTSVKQVYAEYLGEPCGHKAHELLHTTYVAREKYTKE